MSEQEVWKDVVGYEGLYQVSNLGNVYSVRAKKILKTSTTNGGYKRVVLCRNGVAKAFYVHRIVANSFVDGYIDGMEVNHIDGNTANNSSENLEWVTRSDNIKHSYKFLERVSPAKHTKIAAKLTDKDVINIRMSTDTYKELAKRYNVDWRTIYNVKHFITYSDVETSIYPIRHNLCSIYGYSGNSFVVV